MGTLYIVGTPIGNMEDVTLRALRVLKEVSCVYAEDTRVARKLLTHHEIRVPCERYDDRFPEKKKRDILNRCERGEDIAVVSDAGTPVISDPGSGIAALAHQLKIPVVPIPGPSAPIVALSASGFPASHFVFLGFIPRSRSRVARLLEASLKIGTAVFFESPHRIQKTLALISGLDFSNLKIAVARELTKHFEEIVRGTPEEVIAHFASGEKARGEFCVMLHQEKPHGVDAGGV